MPYVRDDVRGVLDALAANQGPQMHEVDAPTARQMMVVMGQMLDRPCPSAVAKRDLTFAGPAGEVRARLYTPTGCTDERMILFFHGGGFVIGDLETHDGACGSIAEMATMRVLSVDYRLAPEAPFPAATEDCLAATRWALSSPESLGRVSGVVVAGDSAGGNLAAAVARECAKEGVVAQWLIYPATDMNAAEGSMQEFAEGYLLTAEGMRWFMEQYRADPAHRWASPMHAEEWEDLPPALVFTASLDPLRDQGRAYAAKLAQTGHRVIYREAKGQVHGSLNARGGIPSAQDDLAAQVRDLKALLDG